jgi:hypothetical protein
MPHLKGALLTDVVGSSLLLAPQVFGAGGPHVNFVDATVVALADPTTRSALFDQDAFAQLVASGYDAGSLGVQGPYSAVFDELELGLFVPRRGSMVAQWGMLGGSDRSEGLIQLAGVGADSSVRVDGLWRGSIVARVVPLDSHVDGAAAAHP